MLSREYRLTSDRDIRRVAKHGYRVPTPSAFWKALRREGEARRFTVVISTKVSKKAVERNRIKRVLRELIRERLDQFPAGADYLVVIRPLIPLPRRADLLRDTEKALATLTATHQ